MSETRRSHITPQGYLRRFADDDGFVTVHRIGSDSQKLAVSQVAVRRDFYRRRRPDGTMVADVEESMQQLESRATPLLSSLLDRWPLTGADKAVVAEFLGLQYLRGVHWRRWHERFIDSQLPAMRRDFSIRIGGVHGVVVSDSHARGLASALKSDTNRLVRMTNLSGAVATIFGSMHWTLLQFGEPLLLSSDHPIVLWPMTWDTAVPQPSPTDVGVINCLEVRFPVSPTLALLGAWRDTHDAPIRESSYREAAKLNAFTRAQADVHWFHKPGSSPPIAEGRQWPLSLTVHPDYSATAAARSQRHERASELANERAARTPTEDDNRISIVEVT